MIRLDRPHVRVHRSYLEAHDEFGGGQRDGDGDWVEAPDDGGYAGVAWTREELETDDGFARFVQLAARPRPRRRATPDRSRAAHVLLGRRRRRPRRPTSARSRCGTGSTPFLLEVGGHIGYSVRPSARRRGVATEALRLVLPHAAALGIDPALLTCDVDNVASARVIEANGGVLEDVRGVKKRYWVPTGG